MFYKLSLVAIAQEASQLPVSLTGPLGMVLS